ncbi:hypothetical protein FI667_g16380, partial [Globisporangium splendens]
MHIYVSSKFHITNLQETKFINPANLKRADVSWKKTSRSNTKLLQQVYPDNSKRTPFTPYEETLRPSSQPSSTKHRHKTDLASPPSTPACPASKKSSTLSSGFTPIKDADTRRRARRSDASTTESNEDHREKKSTSARMPRHRIPLKYTNRFKLEAVAKTTNQTWERKKEQLEFRLSVEAGLAARHTLGGSGRVSETSVIEDQLLQYVKDLRSDEYTVSRLAIVTAGKRLLPAFFVGKSPITHSGRKTRPELLALKDAFVIDVSTVLIAHFVDPVTRLPLRTAVYMMDQTVIFCTLGSKTTVEVIGGETVPAVCGGNDSWRCTVALTLSADGQMHGPHFVFKVEPGGEVEREVRAYTLEEVGTFSVQRNAWFDVRVMLEWIENCWQYIVSEPCILILDSLAVHKCDGVIEALARCGTAVKFVPPGCTGVAQLLDVGVMGPLKTHIRTSYAEYYFSHAFPDTAAQRRKDITVRNSFHKSGPFIPFGPPNEALVDPVADFAEEETIVYEF